MSIAINNIKVVFMGTPDFGVPCLLSLIKETNIIAVVTQPDKKVGRKQEIIPSPIKKTALEYNIKVFQPEKIKDNTEFISQIKELQPDLIVVVAYGLILPQKILNIPQFGVINVHASLLPKYRGASPIQSAILNGDKESGVSIMLLDEKMDHGSIIAKKSIAIDDKDNLETLHDKLARLGSELLTETLPKYINEELQPIAQDESKATYCDLIKKEDGKIDWNKSAVEIKRQIRAFTPWPGAYAFWGEKQIKIIKSKVIESENHKVGEVIKINNSLVIQCGKDALEILELQIEGKKVMKPQEFLNGHPDIIGTILK